MEKNWILYLATLFITASVYGQDLFFIGERSYHCTEPISLKSNSDNANDLSVIIAKVGETGLIAVSTKAYLDQKFNQKLVIYLKDGAVITCNDREESENVDDHAKAIYKLKSDQLNKMKNSDIHTIRYTLEIRSNENGPVMEEENWTASNKGTSTKTIITKFFD